MPKVASCPVSHSDRSCGWRSVDGLPAPTADLGALRALAADGEEIVLKDRVLYLLAPDGVGRSKLATKIEAHLSVPVTARNLRSAQKIAELAREM